MDTPVAASNAFVELVFLLMPRMADQGGVDIKLDWEVC